MKVLEAKIIFESDEIEKYQKIISDVFYNFGVTGLKIEEPNFTKDPLNFYKDEKQFLLSENSISAYFPQNIYSEKRKKVLSEAFAEKFLDDETIVYTLDFYEYDEDDYQNSWKKYLFTEKVSKNFVVKPTWREYEKQDDEYVIELDPGRAFGTGSHPTTSLILNIMEDLDFKNKSVIDIGTGSGILMIASELLGAKETYGTDIDEFSIEAAKENLELNKVDINKIKILKGNLLEVLGSVAPKPQLKIKEQETNNILAGCRGEAPTKKDNSHESDAVAPEYKKFDIVLCNILSDVLIMLLDEIQYILHEDSQIIFSGIIEDKLSDVIKKAESVGLEVVKIEAQKEWRALLLKKK